MEHKNCQQSAALYAEILNGVPSVTERTLSDLPFGNRFVFELNYCQHYAKHKTNCVDRNALQNVKVLTGSKNG